MCSIGCPSPRSVPSDSSAINSARRILPGVGDHCIAQVYGQRLEPRDHLFTHTRPGRLSDGELIAEITRTGRRRAPRGFDRSSPARPTATSRRAWSGSRPVGLEATVLWSVEPRDWAEDATAERVARHVVRRAGPGDIVLLHDGGRRPSPAVTALAEVLEGLARTGLQPVTVSE